ncbi:MAG: hypothetical protein NC191_04040 [Muribaculaceae bacterium]|nr:hypothetical protein [Muribaculaceae bacterium]
MNIQPTNQYTFKGYDARALHGFLMSSNIHGIADEMFKIGEKEGFKIFSPYGNRFGEKCTECLPPKSKIAFWVWAQDYWTILKDNLIARDFDKTARSIHDYFKLKFNPLQSKIRKNIENMDDDFIDEYLFNTHIPGGNIFITKNGKRDEILIGQDELKKFSIQEIKKMYGVKKVITLPQMDFHIDMFIRPLDKKRILLADDNMSLDILNEISKKLPNRPKLRQRIERYATIFENMKARNKLPQTDEIEKILKENNYEVIRVPGRIYTTLNTNLMHHLNFMNANVLINNDGELVYITNKSQMNEILGLSKKIISEIGGSFEEYFTKIISKYVSPKHIYFVSGNRNYLPKKLLPDFNGGIHCACAEIPNL